jgi:hypothetical protein
MKLLLIPCFCFIILAKVTFVYSQDTINLLNGKQIFPRTIHEEQNSALLYYDLQVRGKLKQKAVDLLDVYSINYANMTSKQVYQQDSGLGYILSVHEMQHYIIGERTAMKYYKVPWITAGGIVIGAAGVVPLGFIDLLTPVVYGVGIGFIGSKIQAPEDVKQTYGNDNNFINGYKTISTQKRVKYAILGTFAGIVAGTIADFIIVGHIKW